MAKLKDPKTLSCTGSYVANPKQLKITVRLNGTDKNPWQRWGLRCNPFPQIAKAEYMPGMRAIQSLDGDPLTGPDDIKKRLGNTVTKELVDLCCSQFQPGKRVEFDVYFPE